MRYVIYSQLLQFLYQKYLCILYRENITSLYDIVIDSYSYRLYNIINDRTRKMEQ